MKFTDLLTISMPVYERKDFFLEAIESAINQTVKCDIIVFDNCSSHNYFERICKEKGVTYYRNETNIGMAANFARGFEVAKTKFVMNLQDDDILSPNYVESFLDAYQKHPDIDIYFSNFILNTPDGRIPHKHTLPFGYMKDGEKVLEYGIKYKLGFPYMASVIKRSKVNGFSTDFHGSYDWLWVYSNADNFVFYGDSRELYDYRFHDKQDTRSNAINYRLTIPYIYDEVLKHKAPNLALKKKASRNAFWELVRLRAFASKKTVNDFIKTETIYSTYLVNKLGKNKLLYFTFLLPRNVVNLLFRFSRKVGLIQ